ncbi:helix-turn-helix domain-containing protein [Halobacillus sp. A1]|uniref:helix-turn-helix domain-containing protein n=1 Tax=Halobacillus sp. A1 TaxID=2880262 RepID=UPI0020A6AF48|nr:helix-turn-helix transcriptional regulator [Halobacillus sp. A1]MCP3032888.1 helix-turn-helix domain-containing protein [Halobacillus sp. A1]
MNEKHIEDAAVAFGTKIRHLRSELNISQEELGNRTNVSTNHIGYIERAERQPSLKLIIAIAFALPVHPATLFDTIELPSDPEFYTE